MVDYSLIHISGPATEPASLTELKAQVNLDSDDTTHDDLLTQYLKAARKDVEGYLGKKIGTQVWDIHLDGWPPYVMWRVPLVPLISVDSVSYTDEDGDEDTVDGTVYQYSAARNTLFLRHGQTWPSSVHLQPYAGVVIRVTVGMQPVTDGGSPETEDYPAHVKQMILLRAASLFRIREDVTLGSTLTAVEVKAFERIGSTERNLVP
jgi:uncharacterized phiE125 gp8 family phage protein